MSGLLPAASRGAGVAGPASDAAAPGVAAGGAANAEPCADGNDAAFRSSALLDAAGRGDATAMDAVLVTAGGAADLEATDSQGRTALFLASSRGHAAVVSRLLELGAQARGRGGRVPFIAAWTAGHDSVARLLASSGEAGIVDGTDTHGRTALFLAAAAGLVERVEGLMRLGADPGVADERGMTPVLQAMRRRHHGCISRLAAIRGRACRLDEAGSGGETALLTAAKRGQWRLVGRLLEEGADPGGGARPGDGRSPAALALMAGHWRTLRVLAETRHESLLGVTCGPDTLMCRAVWARQGAVVECLVEAGTAAEAKDPARWPRSECYEVTGCPFVSPLELATQSRYEGMVQSLLASGRTQGPDALGRLGLSCLHQASIYGRCRVVRALLDAGGNSGATDNRGQTSIILAARHACSDVLALLLSAGGGADIAVVNATTTTGESALSACTAPLRKESVGSEGGLLEACAALLLRHGADPIPVARGADEDGRAFVTAACERLVRQACNWRRRTGLLVWKCALDA